MRTLKDLVRPNIWRLAPYSSARNEYSGSTARIFLDANENPYNKPFNRYPDPLQKDLNSLFPKSRTYLLKVSSSEMEAMRQST